MYNFQQAGHIVIQIIIKWLMILKENLIIKKITE